MMIPEVASDSEGLRGGVVWHRERSRTDAGGSALGRIRGATRDERVLAVGRAFLTVTALGAIYLDPTEPARLREITYGVLLGYAAYSLAVLAFVYGRTRLIARDGKVLHGLDILWTSALTFVSEGPVSPFFLFFLFVVVAAAYRWGFRETAGSAVITVGVLLVETAVAATGPWNDPWFSSMEFELNRTILRVAYLLLTGVLVGYLAEQEKLSRAELAALAALARQQHVELGLGGSISVFARSLLHTFNAASLAAVVHDIESDRTFLWAADLSEPEVIRRTELTADAADAWLFRDPGRAWHVSTASAPATARTTEPDVWRLGRHPIALPDAVCHVAGARTVAAVNLGLAGEWQARIYLFDMRPGRGLERRLHLLEALSEQITPALTNVFLLRRLRARAGAAERARVARELHDGAIQALFGLEMRLAGMRRQGDAPTAALDGELAEIQALLRQEALALRELMQALRPIELDSSDQLPDVLAAIVERFRRDTGISARFVAAEGPFPVRPARAVEIVRIVQEALVNTRKHSGAKNVLVRMSQHGSALRLDVEDDGRGFPFDGRLSADELDRQRLGPAIIKERARIAGAQLSIESSPDAGARLELLFETDPHA